jgi:putative type I restriction-modification system specificity subunit
MKFKLGDICSRLSSGKGISAKLIDDVGKFPVYGGNGLRGYTAQSNFFGECAIIGRQGAFCGNVRYFSGEAYMTEHAIVVCANKDNNTRYLAYLLGIMKLGRLSGQSAQPGLSVKTLAQQDVDMPPLEQQRKVAKILATIEKKIELNNKINENLTDQAQAIYQQHFVTKANPDWPLGHLSDLINVKYGKDHKKLADGAYPVYGSGGIMRYVEHPLYEKESVLIPRKGTLNNVMYVNQPFWSVDTMFYTEMKQANVAKFVYHYVKSKDLASMNAGSAVPSMTTAILNAMELRIPSEEALFQFENSVAPMYEMIKKNEDQSRKLAQLRDVLLSKLMSGEIDVSNLDL